MTRMLYATLTLGWALSSLGMITGLQTETGTFRSAQVTLTDGLNSIGPSALV